MVLVSFIFYPKIYIIVKREFFIFIVTRKFVQKEFLNSVVETLKISLFLYLKLQNFDDIQKWKLELKYSTVVFIIN